MHPNIVDAVVTKPADLPHKNVTVIASILGSCEFNNSGKLISIDTLFYSGQSPDDFKDFGEFSNLGHYIVISRYSRERKEGVSYGVSSLLFYSGTERNSDLFFPVLLNGEKKWWWADCRAKKIGRLSSNGTKETSPTSQNALSIAVSHFVCKQ